ncbi:MAG TPA: hypothetical protein VFJ58_04585 [Armatimonadota bacterium]|nr:hypothetical protein [Armatimonadota bacterium]
MGVALCGKSFLFPAPPALLIITVFLSVGVHAANTAQIEAYETVTAHSLFDLVEMIGVNKPAAAPLDAADGPRHQQAAGVGLAVSETAHELAAGDRARWGAWVFRLEQFVCRGVDEEVLAAPEELDASAPPVVIDDPLAYLQALRDLLDGDERLEGRPAAVEAHPCSVNAHRHGRSFDAAEGADPAGDLGWKDETINGAQERLFWWRPIRTDSHY